MGKEKTRERVEEIVALATKHGFRLGGFRSFWCEVSFDQIDIVRQHGRAKHIAISNAKRNLHAIASMKL